MNITITPEGADCTAHSFISSTGILNILINVEKRFALSYSNSTSSYTEQPAVFVFEDEDESEIKVECLPETQEEKDGLERSWFLRICKGQFHFLFPSDDHLLTEKQAKWRAER